MFKRFFALFFSLMLLTACDVFPTKESKKQEENQKWWDSFYGNGEEKKDDYCKFYGTCKKGKSEESSWDWWTGGTE